MAVEAMIAVSGMLVIAESVAEIFRDAKFCSCAIVPVVIPDENVSVHCVPGTRTAVVAVKAI
jgi:hypothetical protein